MYGGDLSTLGGGIGTRAILGLGGVELQVRAIASQAASGTGAHAALLEAGRVVLVPNDCSALTQGTAQVSLGLIETEVALSEELAVLPEELALAQEHVLARAGKRRPQQTREAGHLLVILRTIQFAYEVEHKSV